MTVKVSLLQQWCLFFPNLNSLIEAATIFFRVIPLFECQMTQMTLNKVNLQVIFCICIYVYPLYTLYTCTFSFWVLQSDFSFCHQLCKAFFVCPRVCVNGTLCHIMTLDCNEWWLKCKLFSICASLCNVSPFYSVWVCLCVRVKAYVCANVMRSHSSVFGEREYWLPVTADPSTHFRGRNDRFKLTNQFVCTGALCCES